MMLDEILDGDYINYEIIDDFVKSKGIKNISVDDLDRLIDKFGGDVTRIVDFYNLYNIVSTNETNKTIKNWTRATGVLTFIVTVATLISLFSK